MGHFICRKIILIEVPDVTAQVYEIPTYEDLNNNYLLIFLYNIDIFNGIPK